MRIGVIGNGVVGSAIARTWLEHAEEVRVWDRLHERATHSIDQLMTPGACGLPRLDITFICVPETQIEVLLANLPYGWDRNANYVLKSTVPLGTTRRLRKQYQLPNLVHSPEFLTARCSFTDAQLPARNIIGEPAFEGERTCTSLLHQMYVKRFPGIPVHFMASDESEAVKLMTNSFFACKVSIFNEFNQLCQKLGLNWDAVLGGILSDGRIAHAHTQVPGPDGKYGFDGACLPKDLKMLAQAIRGAGGSASMCAAAYIRNLIDRERSDATEAES